MKISDLESGDAQVLIEVVKLGLGVVKANRERAGTPQDDDLTAAEVRAVQVPSFAAAVAEGRRRADSEPEG